MNTYYNGAVVESNGVRSVAGGGTGASTLLKARYALNILDTHDFGVVSDNASGTNFGTGTNVVYGGVNGRFKETILGSSGATANSSFGRTLRIWEAGSSINTINFAQTGIIEFKMYFGLTNEPPTANSIFRVGLFNSPQADNVSGFLPISQGYGIEIRNLSVWLVSHDGTNPYSMDSGLSINGNGAINTIRIIKDGTGLRVSINGTTSSALTSLPTATVAALNGSNGIGAFQAAGTNGSTAADVRIWINREIKMLFGF